MYIVNDRIGQMCNRLFAIIPIIAHAIEKKNILLITSFTEYIALLENKHSKNVIFGSYKLLLKILLKINNYIDTTNIFKFVSGWNTIDDYKHLVIKHKQQILKVLKINSEITTPIDDLFSHYNSSIKIGIHIRRGDYKTWRNGQFYFPVILYANIARELMKQFQTSNTVFYISSNENIDRNLFNGLKIINQHQQSSPFSDLYALSKCDYIFGPPSTFSQFASFYNDVPLLFIMDKDPLVKINSFSPIIFQDHFKNGQTLNIN